MRQMGLFVPETSWEPPTELPDIPAGTEIAVDTETRDNGFAEERGPGWTTGDGHVAGFSVAWSGGSLYIPLRHPETNNIDTGRALGWLQQVLDRAGSMVYHNSPYDTGWLKHEGLRIDHSRCEDTQFGAVMLGENELSYSLDSCCRRAGLAEIGRASCRERVSSPV